MRGNLEEKERTFLMFFKKNCHGEKHCQEQEQSKGISEADAAKSQVRGGGGFPVVAVGCWEVVRSWINSEDRADRTC